MPGKSANSLLIKYVTGRNDDGIVMPPEGERLTKKQIDLLRAWIDAGAKWPDDLAGVGDDARRHWAFRVPRRPALQRVRNYDWIRSPVDAFVLAQLQREGLTPSPRAGRVTLVRRLWLDLLGLPPTPDEVDGFLSDNLPGAYERLVDRLLASPAFGERWGRHWLDLARYADSNGYEDDRQRPDAWRFRDWVIRACNADMPFDEFTVWQLAGDLLPAAGYEQKLATGFHRMTLSNSGGAKAVAEEFRISAVKDRANTTGAVWLGLTVGCAQCHSHKYDPLSQREYYQLFAFFNDAKDVDLPAPPPPARYVQQHKAAVANFTARFERAKAALAKYENDQLPGKQAAWEGQAAQDAGNLPRRVRAALSMPREKRTEGQRLALANFFKSIDADHVALTAAVREGDQNGNNRPQLSKHAMVLAKTDRTSHIHLRGDFLRAGAEVEPTTPAFLPPLKARAARADRLDLARWIVDSRNPLTARVAANHVWRRLFGRGLVGTPDDFGTGGEPPSHPDLLDWLATEYVRLGWSRKALIRLIVTSAAYQQSSRRRDDLAEKDPGNALLARQSRMRVEAECVRDVVLAAAGQLNRQVGGPSFQPPLPTGLTLLRALKNERFMEPTAGPDAYRRGVYVNVQRMFMLPMMQTFDAPDPNLSCTRRERSNTPLQALTLLNSPAFSKAARSLGVRTATECDGSPEDRIRFAFRVCLARLPRGDELSTLRNLYLAQVELYRENGEAASELCKDARLPDDVDRAEAAAWVGVARTLLNLDEMITRE